MANPLGCFMTFFRREAGNKVIHLGCYNTLFVTAACGLILASMFVAAGNFNQGHMKCHGPSPTNLGQDFINEKCWNGNVKKCKN